MGNNSISHKIDAYAQANLKALKQEEAKTGRKMTKFDIAQYMLQHGKLNKNEYANWMNTTEGFNAQAMTQAQKTALKQGSVWGFAGYGGGQESYLDSMTSFSQKTPVEKQNAISGHQMKLNETVAERKKKAAEMQKEIKQQQVTNQILNPNQALKEQKFKDHISSLPEVDATYTELMNDIKFQNMDKKQKTEFLLKTTGQKFYEAKERGDKEAMKEYLKQGIGLTFAYMDDKAGITNIKEAVKKYSGLNTVVDAIDKLVDDGDNSNLSLGEKTWNVVKGAGDAVDSMIGTQGVAMVGTLAVAAEAAAAAGIGTAFSVVTQAAFAAEGTVMVVDGAEQVYNAETAEDARKGGANLAMGGMMLYGAAKSAKEGYNNYKMEKSAQQELSNARKTLGLDDGVELTESAIKNAKKGLALKNHPDRGGSVETMQEINNAANLLLKSLNTGSARAAVATGRPAETVNNTQNTPAVKTVSSPKTGTAPTIPTTKMAELAKTPEGIKQMEDAGLVVSKASIDKLGTIHEGQSQSPARAVKKIDFSGTPEEVCAKNPPLQYDKARGKFFREVSWDQGKTKQPMYIEENDPNGYFMINYGEESWDGALLGGTEAIKSYVEPEAYNANGTKIPLNPAKMDYNWTTASKAAPVRFAKVPEGMKGVVGKEGFQPITDNNQVIAIDVKGQPYINTAQYVLDNTKGLDAPSIKALLEIDPKANATKAMSELAKTSEGVKQMENAGLVVSKASIDKLGTIHEGQSQSPARAIKKIDFSGSPEEVCTKNPPLQYDKARGKFFREVSWDGGKTKQPMYIEENDPNGYFMINYGEQPWDGALLGGTEAIKSYVEPEPYNASGTKVALNPVKMDYNWTTASKAAPVRFAKVPKGMKGVVGKEGFQPITGDNQVIAMDVKGQPYINTAQYVLDNTKGLDAKSIKALMEIDPSADASKAILDIARTESGLKELNDVGITVERLNAYADRDGHSVTHGITIDQKNADGNLTTRTYIESLDDSDVGFKSKITTTQYNPNSGVPVESKMSNGTINYDKNGNILSLTEETVELMHKDYIDFRHYDTKKTTVSYEYDQDGLIIKKDIKNDYENLRRTDSEEFVLRDLTEKTKYGTHRKQIKLINGHKVGIEEIPNKDGSTIVKLVNSKGQCVTREIPKGKKYEINAGHNELRDGVDVFVYEYGKMTNKETLMSIKKGYYFEPPKTDFTQYKHYNGDIIPVAPDITTPKTSLETNFFEE